VFMLMIIYFRKGVKNVVMIGFGLAMAAILIVMYRATGFDSSLANIYGGITGRTIFTQFGVLAYHMEYFGWAGVVFSIVWVGLVISMLFYLIVKIKKTPATIAFLAVMTKTMGAMSQGGFFDFIYSFSTIVTILGFLFIIYFSNIMGLFTGKRKKEKVAAEPRGSFDEQGPVQLASAPGAVEIPMETGENISPIIEDTVKNE